jgi:hypothetical protein
MEKMTEIPDFQELVFQIAIFLWEVPVDNQEYKSILKDHHFGYITKSLKETLGLTTIYFKCQKNKTYCWFDLA